MRRLAILVVLLFPSLTLGDSDCSKPVPPLAVIVRPTDIDDKGHVNHARHIEYLQWGRWDWMSRMGVSPERIRKDHNVALVVVNVNFDYKREISFGETVFVKTTIARVGDKSVTFHHQIVDRMLETRAEGTVTMVCIDLSTRKSCQLPNPLAEVFRASNR